MKTKLSELGSFVVFMSGILILGFSHTHSGLNEQRPIMDLITAADSLQLWSGIAGMLIGAGMIGWSITAGPNWIDKKFKRWRSE